jgi:hypothetical protein
MKNISFTDEEKVQLFDEIATHFYNANFGQLSKSDMELLMFHIYVDKLISDNKNPDGTIDYRKCSDYKISKDLGITQQRVRSLKVKKQLIYPVKFDWKLALATLTENARYDKDSKKVVLNIPDPNLYLEIQNFIEENGAYVEKQLNSKVLQIRAEYYIDLIITLEPEITRKSIIKALKEQFEESGKENSKFDERNVGKSLIESAANVTAIAANISSVISPENKVGVALINLILKSATKLTE